MKKSGTIWLLTMFISIVGFDVLADSSKVSSYIFTADGMHLQEVILRLELKDQQQKEGYFLVKKSPDGINFRTIAELEESQFADGTLVLVDHLAENEMTYYQLVRMDADGENIVATTSFDPHAAGNDGLLLGMSGNPKIATAGDPHAL